MANFRLASKQEAIIKRLTIIIDQYYYFLTNGHDICRKTHVKVSTKNKYFIEKNQILIFCEINWRNFQYIISIFGTPRAHISIPLKKILIDFFYIIYYKTQFTTIKTAIVNNLRHYIISFLNT